MISKLKQVRLAIAESKQKAEEIAQKEYNAALEAVTPEEQTEVTNEAEKIGTVQILRDESGKEISLDAYLTGVSNIANSHSSRIMAKTSTDKTTEKYMNHITPTMNKTEEQMEIERLESARILIADTMDVDIETVTVEETRIILAQVDSLKKIIIAEQRNEGRHEERTLTPDEIRTFIKARDIDELLVAFGDELLSYMFDSPELAKTAYDNNRGAFIEEAQKNIIAFEMIADRSDALTRYLDDVAKTTNIMNLVADELQEVVITNSEIILKEALKELMAKHKPTDYIGNGKRVASINAYTQGVIREIYEEQYAPYKGISEEVDAMIGEEFIEIDRLCKVYNDVADASYLVGFGRNHIEAQRKPMDINDFFDRINQMIKLISRSQVKVSFPGYNASVKHVKGHILNAERFFSETFDAYNETAEEHGFTKIADEDQDKFMYAIFVCMATLLKKLTKNKEVREYALPLSLSFGTFSTLNLNHNIINDMYLLLKPVFFNINTDLGGAKKR